MSTVAAFDCFFIRIFGAGEQKPKGGIFGVIMVCKRLIFRVTKLIRVDRLHWLIGFAGIYCLWLPAWVDEMGWGIFVTVQDTLVSNREKGCKVMIRH